MKIQVSRRGIKTGAPPGTLMHIGRDRANGIIITRCMYDENNFFEEKNITPDILFTSKDEGNIEWVNFDGIHDVKLIEEIGRHYSIDMLVLEDIVNATQRPKIEDYNDYIHIVLKMLTYNNLTSEIESEQVSFVFNSRIVLTFQEKNTDDFDTIRDRIRKKGKIRRMGTDYLVYSLLDYIIDNYFLVLEKTGEKIELLEDEVFTSSSRETIKKIHELKREIIAIKKMIWPIRDILGIMIKPENEFINESLIMYIRDAYDHIIEIIETIEAYRDFLAGLHDIYLSSISQRMNEVMKVLTLISTIFIPLTFIVGIYGMNFRNMPELDMKNGYYSVLFIMLFLALAMIKYYKKKKWF